MDAWASRIAFASASVFGWTLIGLGIFSFLSGNLIGGLWWFLIGMFVRAAAQASYQQVLVRRALEGERPHRERHGFASFVDPCRFHLRDLLRNDCSTCRVTEECG